MNIGQLLTSVLSSLIGVYIAGQFIRWQHKRAERDAAASRPVTVPASIRTSKPGRFGGLWRHGTVNIHGGRVLWTPRTPWGRSLVIGSVAHATRKSPAGPFRWLLPSAAVVMPCEGAERRYELAVLPESVRYLFLAQFAA